MQARFSAFDLLEASRVAESRMILLHKQKNKQLSIK